MIQEPSKDLPFLSSRAKYQVFNFHRRKQREKLDAWLGRDSRRSLLLLTGPTGVGKAYLLEAAAWEHRDSIQLGVVDLRGYETGANSLVDYLQHGMRVGQGVQPTREHEGSAATLSLELKSPSIFTVAGASVGLSLKIPIAKMRSFLADSDQLPGPPMDDKARLALFLATLTDRMPLILVVRNAELATDALLGWLVFQCNTNSRLRLVLTSSLTLDQLPAVRPYRPETVPVSSLSRDEVHGALVEFGLEAIPLWLEDHFWNASRGFPGLLAATTLQRCVLKRCQVGKGPGV